MISSCEVGFHKICWRITRKDLKKLTEYDLAGVLIDAESGDQQEYMEAGVVLYDGKKLDFQLYPLYSAS
ncbi:MAG: hypothetical protein AYK18_10220 [Theionarchaea archaeon DG-70]|nr:MAG: hypothetical protein AYK18_10220 [Theionarchaea archaeon DG-70]